MPDSDPEPLPEGGYDPTGLPQQPDHDSPRCHIPGCGFPRSYRHGVLVCRICDAPPLGGNP